MKVFQKSLQGILFCGKLGDQPQVPEATQLLHNTELCQVLVHPDPLPQPVHVHAQPTILSQSLYQRYFQLLLQEVLRLGFLSGKKFKKLEIA